MARKIWLISIFLIFNSHGTKNLLTAIIVLSALIFRFEGMKMKNNDEEMILFRFNLGAERLKMSLKCEIRHQIRLKVKNEKMKRWLDRYPSGLSIKV